MANKTWKVPYINLPQQYENLKMELDSAFKRVMGNADFVLRDDVKKFEESMANFLGVKQVIGVNSGTDALYLSLKAIGLKEGDEVITSALLPYSIFSIINAGAKPILVDVRRDFNINPDKIESAITPNTKAIIPVHLNGRACEMDKLIEIANKHHLIVIEDAAQSLGAMYKGKKTGSFGLIGCFSVGPTKNLSCAGDGGFISTNDNKLAENLKILRNLGKVASTEYSDFGYSSRLDNLQAAILNVKMKYLEEWLDKKRELASLYNEKLAGLPLMLPPPPSDADYFDVYNSYILRLPHRQELFNYLREKGIEVFVPFMQPIYKLEKLNLPIYYLPSSEDICRDVLSLPIFPEMTREQVGYVCDSIHEFLKVEKKDI